MSATEGIDSGYRPFPDSLHHSDEPPSYHLHQPATVGGNGQQSPKRFNETHRRLSISSESDASSVDEDYDVASIASSIDDKLTWRGRMQLALHSHAFHYTIIALVIMDAVIVLVEFLLDVGAFGNIECLGENIVARHEFCHYDSNFRDMCAAPANLTLQGLAIEPANAIANRLLCNCGFRFGRRVCIPVSEDIGVNPAQVLHGFSLAILSIFMIEVLLKMIAFRLKYFTHKFEVFDGIIVVISWTLDVASIAEEEAFEAAALLIVLRLWRVIRIVNGSILASKAQSDNHLKEAKKEAKRIIHAYHKTRDRKVSLENENSRLRKLLEGVGIQSTINEKPENGDQTVSDVREE